MILTREEYPHYAHFFDEAEHKKRSHIFRTELTIESNLEKTLDKWGVYCFHSKFENGSWTHKTYWPDDMFFQVMDRLARGEILWLDYKYPYLPEVPPCHRGSNSRALKNYLDQYGLILINKCHQLSLYDNIIDKKMETVLYFLNNNEIPILLDIGRFGFEFMTGRPPINTPTYDFIVAKCAKENYVKKSTSPYTFEEYIAIGKTLAGFCDEQNEFCDDNVFWDFFTNKYLCADIMKFHYEYNLDIIVDNFHNIFNRELIDWYAVPLDADFSKNIADATREKITRMSADSFLPRDLFTLIMKFTFLSPNLI